MIGYFDSSALVKLILAEEHSDLVADIWDACDSISTSLLAYPEVCSALARSRNQRLRDDLGFRRAVAHWNQSWESIRPAPLTEEITTAAGRLAATHGLSGADAVHLASALAVGRDFVVMTVFDRRLHQAAVAEGLATVPATL
ncbi:MAG: type II toxin-antitoxin system VapC family toxin [Actinomycetes bacterium]